MASNDTICWQVNNAKDVINEKLGDNICNDVGDWLKQANKLMKSNIAKEYHSGEIQLEITKMLISERNRSISLAYRLGK